MTLESKDNYEEDLKYELKEIWNEVLKPWRMTKIGESKSKNYDIYAYKMTKTTSRKEIVGIFESQVKEFFRWTRLLNEKWEDNGNPRFERWEIIYLKVPKSNETIELWYDDIMELNDRDVNQIFQYFHSGDSFNVRGIKTDERWDYILLFGNAKIYINHFLSEEEKNRNGIFVNAGKYKRHKYDIFERPTCMSIWIKQWNKIKWLYVSLDDDAKWTYQHKVYRWNLKITREWILPEWKDK